MDENTSGRVNDPMLELVDALADQLAAAPSLLDAATGGMPRAKRNVLICGMGGSAAAAELAAGLFADEPTSVRVHRSYDLPGWVDDSTLLIFSSYSGDTEETLSAYDEALRRAPAAPRLAISSGGSLSERAAADGVTWVAIPEGLPPRASFGFGFGVLMGSLSRMGAADWIDEGLASALVQLENGRGELGSRADRASNPAARLAKRLYGKLPVLYVGGPLGEACAMRWKAQINENSKALAYAGVLPEIDHNEIVGWQGNSAVRDSVHVVALRDAGDHPRVQRRFELTRSTLGDRVKGWDEVESVGPTPLARALSLVQFGDYLSVYLAQESSVEATPVTAIDELKQRLSMTD